MSTYLNPPEKLLAWLCCEESLTDKLKQSAGASALHVLEQELVITGSWDHSVLGIADDLVFVREIVMYSGETRCWYARTVVGKSVYHANHDFFTHVAENGLNTLLFHEKLAMRQTLDCYSIRKNNVEFSWVAALLKNWHTNQELEQLTLWVRRSCFLIAPKSPFYLIEIFLPEFLDLLR